MTDRDGNDICTAPLNTRLFKTKFTEQCFPSKDLGISQSFKYTESTRQRVEREAMERMTNIYERRKDSPFIFNGLNPWYSPNFPSISDSDVYGQTHTK